MISLHPVYVWSTVGYTNSILFFALFTSWPVVCKRSVFLQFCDQIQTSMHQIFTQIHSTVSIGPSHMHMIPAGPKWDFLLHANTTHPLTIKALQTTERAKLSLLSLPSMWFLTRSCIHHALPGNDLGPPWWNPVVLTTTRPPIHERWFYPTRFCIKYYIPGMQPCWHFTSLEQYNIILSLNFITIPENRTNSPKNLH